MKTLIQIMASIVFCWTLCLGSAFAAIGSGDSNVFTIDNRAVAPEYTLSVSSESGGSVTEPGEGSFNYLAGTVVSISATATADYEFVNWTGPAVNTGSVTDPYAPDTTVRMDADYSLRANFIQKTSPELIVLSPNGGETLSPAVPTGFAGAIRPRKLSRPLILSIPMKLKVGCRSCGFPVAARVLTSGTYRTSLRMNVWCGSVV